MTQIENPNANKENLPLFPFQNNPPKLISKQQTKPKPSKKQSSKSTKRTNDIINYYLKIENLHTFNEYCPFHFSLSQSISQNNSIPKTFLSKHTLQSNVRSQMVDWMLEVFTNYKSSDETFFLCIYIMDQYIMLTRSKLKNEDIYLIGITCIFIASKLEDLYPMRLGHILRICSNNFTENDIKQKELKIIKRINFNVINASIYYFVLCYFIDFKFDNEEEIIKNELETNINELEKICIYFAKMIVMNEIFYEYENSLTAVACVVYGFDVYRSIPQKLNENKEVFINDWIICVVNATEHSFDFIKTIYDKIGMLHSKLDYLEKTQKERYFISTLNPLQTDNTNSNEKKQT